MKLPITVRPLTDAEVAALEAGLHSPVTFTFRRCQILLASAQGRLPADIAATYGCAGQTVRNVLHAFNVRGLPVLTRSVPRSPAVPRLLDPAAAQALRALLHRSPRDFGHPTSLWTLHLAAQVAAREGLTTYQVSHETIRQTLLRLGVRWQRAKHWITSPDPEYLKKNSIAMTGSP